MKRTAEIILTVIGTLFYGLTALMGVITIWMVGNDNFVEALYGEAAYAGEVYMDDINAFLSVADAGGWYLIIVSIIVIILSLVSIFMVRGRESPKAAGILLIVVSVLGGLLTVGLGFIGSVLLLIAGIMCLVRKPQPTT